MRLITKAVSFACIGFYLMSGIFATSAFSAVEMKATGAQVLQFANSAKAKLVFESGGYLYFIDYSAATPAITKMNNTQGGVAPMISPDGNYVTYLTGISSEGAMPGASSAWFCALSANAIPVSVQAATGYNPRFVHNAQQLSVIYSTCGYKAAGDYVWNGCGKTVKRVWNGSSFGPEEVVWAGGGYFGGISWDSRYLATAEQNLNAFMLDLQNSASGPAYLMRITFKDLRTGKDSVWNLQTCNPSISSSRIFTDAMMHLDFGFLADSFTNDRLGSYWGMHARIFISKFDGKIAKFFDVNDLPFAVKGAQANPPGEIISTQYDDPEWSNHPYYAAANVYVDRIFRPGIPWLHSRNHEAVYAINIKDSTYLHLVQSTDTTANTSTTNLQWPWLWIEVPADMATTESKIWLSTNVVNHRIGLSHSASKMITMNGYMVKSSTPIASVTVHNLMGQVIARYAIRNAHQFSIPASALASGTTCFIRVTTTAHDTQVFRLNNLN